MDPSLLDPFFSFSDSAAVIAQSLRCSESVVPTAKR